MVQAEVTGEFRTFDRENTKQQEYVNCCFVNLYCAIFAEGYFERVYDI